MTTHTVTRCPQCKTSFRITPAQLHSARGAVRCGSCLHIFRAQDHLVSAEKPVTAKPTMAKAPQAKAAVGKAPATKAAPSKPAASINPTAPKPTAATNPTRDKAPESKKYTAPTKYSPVEDPKSKADSSGLSFDQDQIDEESELFNHDDFLISDDMGQPQKAKEESAYGDGLSEEFLELDKQPQSSRSIFDREVDQKKEETEDDSDESWAMSLLDDEEPSEQVSIKRDDSQNNESIFKLIEDEPVEAQTATATHQVRTSGYDQNPNDSASTYSPKSGRSALLMNIDPEPVELSWVQTHSHRKWLWSLLALLALVLLIAQVAWLQFDRLSRLQPYRAAYESICPMFGCQVPELIDRRQISAAHLIVRNHPKLENALEVNLMLLNNAPFEQPFPDLVLEFSNMQDQVLAIRRFTPGEYLAGELTGRRLMPRNRPIRLTLELVHPGADAVNYRAYIPD